MLILAITTDDGLVNRLKKSGQVMKCNTAETADQMIKSGEFDAVILGPPYTDIKTETYESHFKQRFRVVSLSVPQTVHLLLYCFGSTG